MNNGYQPKAFEGEIIPPSTGSNVGPGVGFAWVCIEELGERPSLTAFKEWMCNRYRVKSVDDIPISVNEYAEKMTIFEAGWSAREHELLDRMLSKAVENGN